jgi:multicomponent Na+:H+ antiporter subunit A
VELTTDMAVLLIVLAPFVAAMLAPVIHRGFGAATGWLLAIVPAVSFYYLFQMLGPVAAGGAARVSLEWGAAHGLALSFFIDGLSLTFALTITGIGAFILIYSGAYLKGHPHQGRFFSFMMLFMGAMLGLVLADSGVVLYVFWELTTLASFLLIGFDHTRQAARRAAIQAFLVTGIGGLALLAAVILLQRLAGAWELSAINTSTFDVVAHPAYGVLLTLVLLAAFTKSAQVPFHFWLPNAMEAPTPVSAFLHSATMVQGGVYLLLRLTPSLGGSAWWTGALVIFGGATLLWGGVRALRQTDMKQMLAQTTIASLGLLVMLIGVGTEAALTAAVIYFLAHALYKAGLFLVIGIIDLETGTRDLTALGGLRDHLALTFIAAVLVGASMFGLPPLLGYFAKEEMYLALTTGDWTGTAIIVTLILGNGLLGGVALAVGLRPFMGSYLAPPKTPHEASFSLLAGPLVFGALGVAAGFVTQWLVAAFIGPAATAAAGQLVEPHLGFGIDPGSIIFWLSVLTWLIGALVYWRLDRVRTALRRNLYSSDLVFDAIIFGLIRFSATVTRALHHGRLELYLVVVFSMLALALIAPLWLLGGLPQWPRWPDLTFYEWATLAIAAIGVAAVVLARTRLFAILALGIQGFAVALIYLLFGAPDLSFTQFMVEVLSVVILALVMTRLHLEKQDPREFEDLARDGSIALLCGLGLTTLLFAVLEGNFDSKLSDFFNSSSVPLAHGRNVVNVVIVDFRGLDTLGEITVVLTAGLAILTLIRATRRKPA